MSRNCCNTESYDCNNNCCNPCNSHGNGLLGSGGSWLYTLAILLLFGGGGFGPGSFWGIYNSIFRCSGFNNHWCDSSVFNNIFNTFNAGTFSSENNFNSNFSANNLSNTNLTGLLGGFSDDSNFDIRNNTELSN